MTTAEKAFELAKLNHDVEFWKRELELLPPHEQLQRRFAIAMLEMVDAELRGMVDA